MDPKMKKPFQTPKLKVYGDVRSITEAVANNSTVLDGGTMNTKKTA